MDEINTPNNPQPQISEQVLSRLTFSRPSAVAQNTNVVASDTSASVATALATVIAPDTLLLPKQKSLQCGMLFYGELNEKPFRVSIGVDALQVTKLGRSGVVQSILPRVMLGFESISQTIYFKPGKFIKAQCGIQNGTVALELGKNTNWSYADLALITPGGFSYGIINSSFSKIGKDTIGVYAGTNGRNFLGPFFNVNSSVRIPFVGSVEKLQNKNAFQNQKKGFTLEKVDKKSEINSSLLHKKGNLAPAPVQTSFRGNGFASLTSSSLDTGSRLVEPMDVHIASSRHGSSTSSLLLCSAIALIGYSVILVRSLQAKSKKEK